MADITLSTRTTDISRAQSAVYGGARAGGSARAAPADPAAASGPLGPTTTVTSTIAADVLLAAQQARTAGRERSSVDVRAAYDRAPRRDPATDRIPPDDGAQTASNAQSTQSTGSEAATTLGDNVVRLFATSSGQSTAETFGPRDRADYARANQAYVGAGAADGLAFSTSGVDTSLRPEPSGFDILV